MELRHRIECYVAGVIDVSSPMASTRSRLNALTAYRKARTTLSWKKLDTDVPLSHNTEIRVFGPVCCLLSRRSLRFVQPERPLLQQTRREWSISDIGFDPIEFCYDHSQRLLVLLEEVYV